MIILTMECLPLVQILWKDSGWVVPFGFKDKLHKTTWEEVVPDSPAGLNQILTSEHPCEGVTWLMVGKRARIWGQELRSSKQAKIDKHLSNLYGQPLDRINTYKYTGLLLSSYLSWTQYTNNIIMYKS